MNLHLVRVICSDQRSTDKCISFHLSFPLVSNVHRLQLRTSVTQQFAGLTLPDRHREGKKPSDCPCKRQELENIYVNYICTTPTGDKYSLQNTRWDHAHREYTCVDGMKITCKFDTVNTLVQKTNVDEVLMWMNFLWPERDKR